jgi:hypothetical protein
MAHFASAAWGRNVSLALAALAAIILGVLGNTLGIVIVIALVMSEGLLALRFARSRLRVDSASLIYTPLLGPTRTIQRSVLRQVEVGRPMMGFLGRSPRMAFAASDGRPLLVLDPTVWSPDDVARIAAVIGIPLTDWREPKPRGAIGHAVRLALAAAALILIVTATVATVVVIVLLR